MWLVIDVQLLSDIDDLSAWLAEKARDLQTAPPISSDTGTLQAQLEEQRVTALLI